MADGEARKRLAQDMDEIARGVSAATIEAEVGPMCTRSFFQLLHEGAPVTQAEIEAASRSFATATERLMPAALVARFVEHACATGHLPEVRHVDLAPGFASSEAFAYAAGPARLASPAKKLTEGEVLGCLAWNERDPRVPTAIALLVQLVEMYVEGLRQLVARRSPEAASRLAPFARQWAPKNVLKFLNAAIYVAGRRRDGADPVAVDRALVEDAMDLLHGAGAFTWDVPTDPTVPRGDVTRIHTPAQAFLHRLVAKENALVTVLDAVVAEAAKRPPSPVVARALALVEQRAITEQMGIRSFGQEWSRMKLEP
jgi:hypothetical protein